MYVGNMNRMNRKSLLLDPWVLTNHLPLIRFIERFFMQPEQMYLINSKSMTNLPPDMPVLCAPPRNHSLNWISSYLISACILSSIVVGVAAPKK